MNKQEQKTYCSHCDGTSKEFSRINLSCFIAQTIKIITRLTTAASDMIPEGIQKEKRKCNKNIFFF